MVITIRKTNLEDLNGEGIPRDFAEVMRIFNEGITSGSGWYRFVPRRGPITIGEIRDRWMPNADSGIGLVAESDGRIVGSIAVIYDRESTAYEHRGHRKPGAIGEGVDIGSDFRGVFGALYVGLIGELERSSREARAIFPVEDLGAAAVLRELGYWGNIVDHKPYSAIGLSGKGLEFSLPKRSW
ncbi:MAG: hypothetical protein ABIG28_01820 [archaeon]